MLRPSHIIVGICFFLGLNAQMMPAQVKISEQPFPVQSATQLNEIVWTMVGRSASNTIYCVSDHPVSQLRFVCVDCPQKNITDIVNVLNSAQDMTRTAGFPTVALRNVEANPSWSGVTIICQAALSTGPIDSVPAQVVVRYLRQVHVVDANGQGPVVIPNQGLHFYVECNRLNDNTCQGGRRKTLRCSNQANPPATSFRWMKNGITINNDGPELSIGVEMIGQSIQCSANNGLFDENGLSSEAVSIDPYSAARVVNDNFQQVLTSPPFNGGSKVSMEQTVKLSCTVEANPRPIVYWKLQHPNNQIVDAPCGQGLNGVYKEIQGPLPANVVRLSSICELHLTNYSYSGQYWCSACSIVSQGNPECSPSLEMPGERTINLQVQGPPMVSDILPTVEQYEEGAVVSVHYCADPAPLPPREIVFSIDGNDLYVGNKWQNFHFEANLQNSSSHYCAIARLRISPVREDDQSRVIFLKVQNSHGSRQITVPLSDLLGVDSSDIGQLPAWVLVLLGIIVVVLVAVVGVMYCIRQQIMCFAGEDNSNTDYSQDNFKQPPHDTYSDDIQRGLYGSSTSEHANASHESLKYLEMNLTDRVRERHRSIAV
ncbi:unnamed protein product [Bursaphelenchus okinawaensis]|uniref:Ig-like domain-containing protein n=1 Tax=Bursaphelenchus okinawaensis TaxID=465554 RepID=A0A811KK85_9BILA|nr:unnamed protein product [Bursaphelenchus okinawaensis]CAG9104229.1 unnamed protein product [Bursaphelenchus okinawaensis]